MNVLVIGIGNPSRGDDALGPALVDRLARHALAGIELLTDYQLQVEFLLDLHGRDAVIFVDASVRCTEPFSYAPAGDLEMPAYTTHALPPEALLAAYRAHYRCPPPAAYILAMRGYSFELGDALSVDAARNMDAAEDFLVAVLRQSAEFLANRTR